MELNEYQQKTLNTWGGEERLPRAFLGVCGEAGELAEGLKKYYRGDFGIDELKKRALNEMGDILFYIAVTAHELGISLEEVGRYNNEKLAKRFAANKIKGDGDYR